MRTAPPQVTAIVLNWQGEDDTAACIDSLLGQRGVDVRILLVDNASPDGSGQRLHARYPQLDYLETSANLGYAGGNNEGLRWALERGAEWILVVNNDTVAAPDCLARLCKAAAREPRVGALAPLIVRHDDPGRIWFAGGTFSPLRALGTHEHEGERTSDVVGDSADEWRECSFLTGCCLLLRADALRDVGLFRADYFAYVEDVELCLRLRRAGWRLGWVPGAQLAHRVPPFAAPPSAFQIVMRDRNRRRLVREHYTPGRRAAFLLWFWPTRMVHLVRYLVAGDLARTKAILTGMTRS